MIGARAIAEAVMDRIVHNAYTIFNDGKISVRERLSTEREKN